jgi:transposase
MEEVSVIGIDLAKRVFQLCAMTRSATIVWEKRLRRAAFIKFLEDEAPRCLVGLEACGGAHHWARWLVARGFSVKLMPAKTVKAYREGVQERSPRRPSGGGGDEPQPGGRRADQKRGGASHPSADAGA